MFCCSSQYLLLGFDFVEGSVEWFADNQWTAVDFIFWRAKARRLLKYDNKLALEGSVRYEQSTKV